VWGWRGWSSLWHSGRQRVRRARSPVRRVAARFVADRRDVRTAAEVESFVTERRAPTFRGGRQAPAPVRRRGQADQEGRARVPARTQRRCEPPQPSCAKGRHAYFGAPPEDEPQNVRSPRADAAGPALPNYEGRDRPHADGAPQTALSRPPGTSRLRDRHTAHDTTRRVAPQTADHSRSSRCAIAAERAGRGRAPRRCRVGCPGHWPRINDTWSVGDLLERFARSYPLGPKTAPELDLCCALGGTRTPNLLIRSQMLYPLSYERRSGSDQRVPHLVRWEASTAPEHDDQQKPL